MNKLSIRRLALAFILVVSGQTSQAASAQWSPFPVSGIWTNSANWVPMTVPNGLADTATFGISTLTTISESGIVIVDGIIFNAGASSYNIRSLTTSRLVLGGTGIVNNSGIVQTFTALPGSGDGGIFAFANSASAGSSTLFINGGSSSFSRNGGMTLFFDTSTASNSFIVNNPGTNGFLNGLGGSTQFIDNSMAGQATITSDGSSVQGAFGGDTRFWGNSSADHGTLVANGAGVSSLDFFFSEGGSISFNETSTAGEATFTANGGMVSDAVGGRIGFGDHSTAGSGNFTMNGGEASGAGGGGILFVGDSTAGSATLIANGGLGGALGGGISFSDNATGGTAQVKLHGNGELYIGSSAAGVTIGSLEGDGNVFVEDKTLTVGSNNLSTTFVGVIQEIIATGGSLTKIGTGTLTLGGANTYTGSTTVNNGALIVNGSVNTPVTVNGGTLGGSGTTGSVTVNSGGTLSPGTSPGILNVSGNLTLTLGATYLVELNGAAVGTQYDQTNVIGIVSLGDATLSLTLGFTPILGTTFEIIRNDLGDPVSGTFLGLNEGATFTAGGQTFTISYHGGDGNDVVLTSAVPEPGTWLLIAMSAAVLVVFQRRCRHIASVDRLPSRSATLLADR
jgi:fibronectin-binding autotransporter adhesin